MRFFRLIVTALVTMFPIVVAFRNLRSNQPISPKIEGVSFVAPVHETGKEALLPVKKVHANWIAITPYAFGRANSTEIRFNLSRQWWGERKEGVAQTIKDAHVLGLKVMIKPHVWVRGASWTGDFSLETEEQWRQWEKQYQDYILSYAQLADSMHAEMMCIGTEFRQVARQRPEFWPSLIKKIRKIYDGKLTYAANWDDYEEIQFWDDLDFIGIDSYFPLSGEKTPGVNHLNQKWKAIKQQLASYANQQQKPILFTEFGYKSIDYTADGHWKYERNERAINMKGQANAYRAIFESFWNEPWFAGGFLWKWYDQHPKRGGTSDKRYTPQNKPAEKAIRQWYGRYSQTE